MSLVRLPFTLPPLTAHGEEPIWQGHAFQVGQEFTQILQYSVNDQGWNDDLTFFHEESAGDNHFIDRASRDYAVRQLAAHVQEETATILEVGCSSGFMLQRLSQAFPKAMVMGSDVVIQPLEKIAALLPSVPLFRFDLLYCPLPDNSVDAIVMLNVLEHIENDKAALQQVYRILKPGGMLIIEVPAGPHLYDIYDKVLMHYRRYRLPDLTKLIAAQGFKITKQSHLGFFLYPAYWLVKQRNKRWLSAPDAMQQKKVAKAIRHTGKNKLMHALMRAELFLGKFIDYPIGIRCLITCKK